MRGINVHMDLAVDESTTLRVYCMHDMLKSEGHQGACFVKAAMMRRRTPRLYDF
jgi:hypothetical protein